MRKKLFKAIAGCAAICFVSGMIVSGNANKAVAAGDIYSDNFDNGFTEDKDAGIYGNGCTLTLVEGMNSNYGGSTESGNCIKVSDRTGGWWENAVFACSLDKLEVGKKYTITFDIYHENGETTTSKGEYGTNRACIVHTMPDYTQYGQPNAAPMNEWERISIDFTYDKAQDFVYLEFAYPEATQEHVNNAYEDPNKEEYYIDNFSIREYVEPTQAPASTTPPAQQNTSGTVETPVDVAPDYLEPGYEETVGNIDYRVIDNDTVAVIGGEAGKKLNIPDTVTIEERAYKVTTINAKAFQDSDIKNLTIGANVTTIGKSAFANCGSLKKITIKSNSLKIGKKAFKGISKKATVKVPKAKKKAYKKLLKKAGLPTKAKIK